MMGLGQFEVPGQGEETLGALRLATAAAHARIERVLGLDAPFSLSHYARVLQGFDSFLHAWEPAVAVALPPPLQPWFDGRRRGNLLARDLAALRIGRSPASGCVPALQGTPAVLGSLYVMEGSALGGQVIARRLQQWHGIDADAGAAYFTGWGPRTGALWREFRQLLAQHVHDPGSRQQACTAAVSTFDALTTTFTACLHEPAAA